MIFESKHAGLTVPIRDPKYFIDPRTGDRELVERQLWVDFAAGGAQGMAPDGTMIVSVLGGAFDTDEAAERYQWTPEEKEAVEKKLLAMARNPKEPLTLWEPPVAVAPIPNWEKLSPARVLALASELDLVPDALAYERATENREELILMLEKKAAALEAEQQLVAS